MRRRRLRRKLMRWQLVVGTPRYFERRYGLRASVSFYLFGVHFKLRAGTTFRHLKVGGRLTSSYGRDFSKLTVWVGSFTTVAGRRATAHGIVATVSLVSRPGARRLPFAPERHRARQARQEA